MHDNALGEFHKEREITANQSISEKKYGKSKCWSRQTILFCKPKYLDNKGLTNIPKEKERKQKPRRKLASNDNLEHYADT